MLVNAMEGRLTDSCKFCGRRVDRLVIAMEGRMTDIGKCYGRKGDRCWSTLWNEGCRCW